MLLLYFNSHLQGALQNGSSTGLPPPPALLNYPRLYSPLQRLGILFCILALEKRKVNNYPENNLPFHSSAGAAIGGAAWVSLLYEMSFIFN